MDERLKKYSRVVTQHVSDELPNFCSLGPFIGLMGGRESTRKFQQILQLVQESAWVLTEYNTILFPEFSCFEYSFILFSFRIFLENVVEEGRLLFLLHACNLMMRQLATLREFWLMREKATNFSKVLVSLLHMAVQGRCQLPAGMFQYYYSIPDVSSGHVFLLCYI